MVLTYEQFEALYPNAVLKSNYHPEGRTYKIVNNGIKYMICPLYNLVDRYQHEQSFKSKRHFYNNKIELKEILSR